MRVASIPAPSPANPFAILLYGELERLGVHFVGAGDLDPRWLLRKRREVDALHLHWPELEFARPGRVATAAQATALAAKLAVARALGYRVLWTVHNLEPHENPHPRLARLGLLGPAWLSSDVFVHDAATATTLVRVLHRRRRVTVTPHGNYLDWYPARAERASSRAELGLDDDAFVFLLLGRMRPYKGVSDALAAFRRAGRASDRLLLAGVFKDDALRREASEAAASDPRVTVVDRVLEDDELPVFFGAADVALLPFRDVTTSGSAILALGFGVPVVATSVGNVVELVTPACGILVPPGDPDALASALQQAHGFDAAAHRSARARAEQFTWSAAAQTIAEALGAQGANGTAIPV